MIDADALLEWVEGNTKIFPTSLSGGNKIIEILSGYDLKNKIHNLSIEFDDDGWCWDMEKAPKDGALFWGYSPSKNNYFMTSYDDEIKGWDPIYDGTCDFTGWYPLPNIPQKKED